MCKFCDKLKFGETLTFNFKTGHADDVRTAEGYYEGEDINVELIFSAINIRVRATGNYCSRSDIHYLQTLDDTEKFERHVKKINGRERTLANKIPIKYCPMCGKQLNTKPLDV